MPKKERIVRYTSEALPSMPSETDWERVYALADKDIEKAIAEDPDAAPILDEDFLEWLNLLNHPLARSDITIILRQSI